MSFSTAALASRLGHLQQAQRSIPKYHCKLMCHKAAKDGILCSQATKAFSPAVTVKKHALRSLIAKRTAAAQLVQAALMDSRWHIDSFLDSQSMLQVQEDSTTTHHSYLTLYCLITSSDSFSLGTNTWLPMGAILMANCLTFSLKVALKRSSCVAGFFFRIVLISRTAQGASNQELNWSYMKHAFFCESWKSICGWPQLNYFSKKKC
jgi:hypothetical protein